MLRSTKCWSVPESDLENCECVTEYTGSDISDIPITRPKAAYHTQQMWNCPTIRLLTGTASPWFIGPGEFFQHHHQLWLSDLLIFPFFQKFSTELDWIFQKYVPSLKKPMKRQNMSLPSPASSSSSIEAISPCPVRGCRSLYNLRGKRLLFRGFALFITSQYFSRMFKLKD